MCRDVDVPELELVLFVRTRWASMFACLDRALKLQLVRTYKPWVPEDVVLIHAQAVTRFTQLADDSDHVPALRNKEYKSFQLSKHEWIQLRLLHKLMKVNHRWRFPRTLQTDH
jgi:hypothetical protein